MLKEEYIRNAVVTKIVDGDTVDMLVDLGFSIAHEIRVRLHGIDTPERGQAGWQEAIDFLKTLAPVGCNIVVKTYKSKDKYGRYLADLYAPGSTATVNDLMIGAQVARVYLP